VKAGTVAISAAVEVVRDPKPDQVATVAAGPSAVQLRAKEIRTAKAAPKRLAEEPDLSMRSRLGGGRIRKVPRHPRALAAWLVREWPRGHVEMLVDELNKLVPGLGATP
jgi:hypothetical protein